MLGAGVPVQVRSMQTGERIAIKADYIKKHRLPFETWGNTVSVMAIKANGVIAENMGDGHRLRLHWQRVSPAREWYFYTYQPTIWKVTPGDWKADALIEFTFQNKPQVIETFRNVPYWRERFGIDQRDHKRFRWARFYQAIADALLLHRADRSQLFAFLQELQPSVEGPRIWFSRCRRRGTGADRRGSLSPPRPLPVPCAAPTMDQSHFSRRSQLQSLRSQALVELSDCCCLRSLPRLGELVDQLLFERQLATPPLAIDPEILQLLPY